jgi:hypothetical protein
MGMCEDDILRRIHRRRITWFWSIVGGICAVWLIFAISSRIRSIHVEWMKCYEMQEKHKSDKYSTRYYCN